MRRDVKFQSEGTTCQGWLYTPDSGAGPHPIVVMAGGWCYVREIVMPHYAEFFVRAGLAVLIFDYRRLGASDGEPRQHIDPRDQVEDYKNAVSFVRRLPEADPERVGVWGISYSGGHVLQVGATDPRVKCIVSTIPVVDGYRNLRRVHGIQGFRKLNEHLAADRERRYETGEGGRIAFAAPDPHETVSTWPLPETYEVFMKLKETEAPLHEHWSTTESTELLLSYSVFPFLPRILNTPTLMLVAEEDDLTLWDLETDAFNRIPTTKKKLFVIPQTSHMSLYSSRSKLEIAAEAATDWLAEHLVRPYEG